MPVPDIQTSPLFDGQSVADSTDWLNISAGFSVTGLISGCVVAAFGSPIMAVTVSAGSVACSGVITAVNAASVTVPAASTTDRRDIVIAGPTGAASVVTGTPCGTSNWTRNTYPGLPPVKPLIPTNCVFLAEVYVAATTTSIASGNIELSPTQLLVTSMFVNSFNTRAGAVTLQQSDVDSTFSAAGQIPIGTGSGTGTYLAVGSVGTVLTSIGASIAPAWRPQTGTGAASAGVQTYNGRFGTVTATAADIEGTFTSPGQLFVGTGTNTGELLTAGSVGTVLTSNGSASIPSWQPATGGGGSASVTAAAIEATFTAPGQVYVGTGTATGQLLTAGSVGTVLTGRGSASVPSWQTPAGLTYPLSTPFGAILPSPVTATPTPFNIFTASVVTTGTWLFNFSGTVGVVGSDAGQLDLKIVASSASVVFLGPTSTSAGGWGGSFVPTTTYGIALSTLVNVITPGTLVYTISGNTFAGCTLMTTTPNGSYPNATGYVATRVA